MYSIMISHQSHKMRISRIQLHAKEFLEAYSYIPEFLEAYLSQMPVHVGYILAHIDHMLTQLDPMLGAYKLPIDDSLNAPQKHMCT